MIQAFWNDSGVQKCLVRRNEFNLMDSSMYYMARLEEILNESYVPTVQDILRVRIPTNGKLYALHLKTLDSLQIRRDVQ